MTNSTWREKLTALNSTAEPPTAGTIDISGSASAELIAGITEELRLSAS